MGAILSSTAHAMRSLGTIADLRASVGSDRAEITRIYEDARIGRGETGFGACIFAAESAARLAASQIALAEHHARDAGRICGARRDDAETLARVLEAAARDARRIAGEFGPQAPGVLMAAE